MFQACAIRNHEIKEISKRKEGKSVDSEISGYMNFVNVAINILSCIAPVGTKQTNKNY